jgi:hypothetical protein
MKLWWVHNEAMVACAMAYDVTRDPAWWKRFEQVRRFFREPKQTEKNRRKQNPGRVQVAEYTMTHFPDTAQNSIQVLVPVRHREFGCPATRCRQESPPTQVGWWYASQPPARTGVTAPPASMQQPGGGWFGYLTREGHVSQRFKGGPYKGWCQAPDPSAGKARVSTQDSQGSSTFPAAFTFASSSWRS